MRTLRLGFIGGSITSAVGYAHYAACRMDGRFALAAGCFSRDATTNAATAEAYGLSPHDLYADWPALLQRERGRLDGVVVLTPTPSHAEIVAACVSAGMPVICEKALGCSSDEVATLLEIGNAQRGFLAVTFNYSGYPMVREMRRVIASGELGRVVQIHADMPQEGFIRRIGAAPAASPQAWRLADGRVPTLSLDLGVHLHQLVHYVTGLKPLEVMATEDRFGCFDVVDNVFATARYERGAVARYWLSKSALGHRNGLSLCIYGEAAAIEWLQSEPEVLTISYADGRREIRDRAAFAPVAAEARYARFKAGHPAGYVEAFANLYADIADALVQYKTKGAWRSDEVFGAELALEGLHFLEAITDSAVARSWRAVPGQRSQGLDDARSAA